MESKIGEAIRSVRQAYGWQAQTGTRKGSSLAGRQSLVAFGAVRGGETYWWPGGSASAVQAITRPYCRKNAQSRKNSANERFGLVHIQPARFSDYPKRTSSFDESDL